jgi:hypothetical protein
MRANNKAAMREHLYDCSFSNAIEGRGVGSWYCHIGSYATKKYLRFLPALLFNLLTPARRWPKAGSKPLSSIARRAAEDPPALSSIARRAAEDHSGPPQFWNQGKAFAPLRLCVNSILAPSTAFEPRQGSYSDSHSPAILPLPGLVTKAKHERPPCAPRQFEPQKTETAFLKP